MLYFHSMECGFLPKVYINVGNSGSAIHRAEQPSEMGTLVDLLLLRVYVLISCENAKRRGSL